MNTLFSFEYGSSIASALLLILMIGLGLRWRQIYGWRDASVIWSLRGLWLLPLSLTLWPHQHEALQIDSFTTPTIALFIDDSHSMQTTTTFGTSPLKQALRSADNLTTACQHLGCSVLIIKGSDLDVRFTTGISPLAPALEEFFNHPAQIYIVFTDGGAHRPKLNHAAWMRQLQTAEHGSSPPPQFIVVPATTSPSHNNIAIDHLHSEPFGFTSTHHHINFHIHRAELSAVSQTVQLKVDVNGQTVAAQNFSFDSHSSTMSASFKLPLLTAGIHLITLTALALPGEHELWDNSQSVSVEILRHSSGVLHLLGSPNSDGRFLRRFLQLDPRFDTLSFFILRDPWDLTTPDERAVSLIPFPVDQLFTQELPHFAVVAMQNFRLSQFLKTEHQRQLVNYVIDGGSLLFIGGPRAFHFTDSHYSALAELLPYDVNSQLPSHHTNQLFSDQTDNTQPHPNLPWYDQELNYHLNIHQHPSWQLSPAASLGDELLEIKDQLTAIKLTGLHRSDQLHFPPTGYLPLITAEFSADQTPSQLPFMAASFKGKGRIIWIFSDSLWKIAMSPQPTIARDLYNSLMSTIFRWLTRDEKNPPITIEAFTATRVPLSNTTTPQALRSTASGIEFTANLYGSGVKYLNADGVDFKLTVCDQLIHQPSLTYLTDDLATIRGSAATPTSHHSTQPPQHCEMVLTAIHQELGQEVSRAIVSINHPQTDISLPTSSTIIRRLVRNLAATAVTHAELLDTVTRQMKSLGEHDNLNAAVSRQAAPDHYYIFNSWWILLCLLAMPLEIWFRHIRHT